MRIRTVTRDELPLLRAIESAAGECFREIGMPEIADDEPLPVSELARYLDEGTALAVVDAADRPVAYLVAEPVDGALHIEQVSVHPEYARRGLGRALINHLAQLGGGTALTLTTFAEVPWNAPYYARCGFRPLAADEVTAGLREIRRQEAAHGLDLRPRLCMRREPRPAGAPGPDDPA